jgi:hypothetical protein
VVGNAGVLVLGAVAGVVGAGVVVPPHPPRSSAQPIATTRQTARRMVVVPWPPPAKLTQSRVKRQCALGPQMVQVTANQAAHIMRLPPVTHEDFLNQPPRSIPCRLNRLLMAIVQTGTCKRVLSAFDFAHGRVFLWPAKPRMSRR